MWNQGVFFFFLNEGTQRMKNLFVFSIGWETAFNFLALLQQWNNILFLFTKLIWKHQTVVTFVHRRSGLLQDKNLSYCVSLWIFLSSVEVLMCASLPTFSSWILYFILGFYKRKWSPLWRRSFHSWEFL